MKLIKYIACLSVLFVTSLNAADINSLLDHAITGDHRKSNNTVRDVYRHPKQTLLFFGMQPDMYVLEILPGRGWYTEILAPVLIEKGKLTVASYGAEHPTEYLANIHKEYIKTLDANPEIYGKIKRTLFKTDIYLAEIPDNSLDMVVTFRNTHNWIRYGGIEHIYAAFYRVLKPGGTLGVVQHRANKGADVKQTAENGYVPETTIIKLAEGLGFELVEKSEINANPKDTTDHPKGVWTLPPTYRLGDVDKEKYKTIGESDRMTLRFIKLP
jgi:predicted methyltransferase